MPLFAATLAARKAADANRKALLAVACADGLPDAVILVNLIGVQRASNAADYIRFLGRTHPSWNRQVYAIRFRPIA